ncbi:MAG: pur operon repressor [Christensenellales bacterium]|jgi:purine operon repressor
MHKIKRSERIGAMIKILSDMPNRIYTLNHFSELFGAAKSTISEDIDIAREVLEEFKLGSLETVTGAAGGVMYLPTPSPEAARRFVDEMCLRLSDPERILAGGYLYMLDELSHPAKVARMGEILAHWFRDAQPDFVVTVETKGISVALMVARCLNVPMITARRDVRISEGSVVTINYVTGSTHKIQSMSLPKRAVVEGQRALIIDDFMKRGGTLRGVVDLMREFSVTVVGMGVVMTTAEPERKLVDNCRSLMVLHSVDESVRRVDVRPSRYIRGMEA